MVIDMLHRGETGIPETPVRMLVEGKWYAGQTLPDRNATSVTLSKRTQVAKPARAKSKSSTRRKPAAALA